MKSVLFRNLVLNEDTIVRFSASGMDPSSFWRDIVYPDIRRGSPQGALKWGTPPSIAKLRPIIGHNLETVQDRR